jgi:hypothetical protein
MKTNVTIRIAYPGAADVDRSTWTGPTVNILIAVPQSDLLTNSVVDFEELFRVSIPPSVYFLFREMIESETDNRAEIMIGTMSYACYRQPLNQEQPIRTPNLAGDDVDKYIDKISKVCFNPCPDLELIQTLSPDETRCNDCPIKGVEDAFKNSDPHGDGLVAFSPVCGNHCPYPVTCRRDKECKAGNTINK